MNKLAFTAAIFSFFVVSCTTDDDAGEPLSVSAPATYSFERANQSTVSFSGQTTRIAMAEELIAAFTDFDTSTEESLLNMFAHEEGAADFSDPALNATGKNLRSKTAASRDYFNTNSSEAIQIKETFESYISTQVNELYPNRNSLATSGQAGQIADGEAVRYVISNGLEMNQLFGKGLVGALMTDQMLNNYLGTAVLDEGTNRSDNDNDIVAEGKPYTIMEHKWDEAYGYLFGGTSNIASPLATLGQDDSFLNKYLGRVESDTDFSGIAQEVYDAFKLGRAAIVAKNYEVRDVQADIIRQKISEVIAIRAVYYLQSGKIAIENGDFGAAFHDLSEGYGFIYSLRFTRNNQDDLSYFSKSEVDGFLEDLMNDGANGLWDVTPTTLDAISASIASKFSFTVADASSTD